MDPKTVLKNYINRILELQDQSQSQGPLTEEELRNVAIDLGMDEGELAFIQQQFEDYKQRAKGFAKYSNWEDAIEEYKQALTLNPIDVECMEEISKGHFERWMRYEKEIDKEEAINFSRRLLEIDPDNEIPLKIISDIKAHENSKPKELPPKNPTKWVATGIVSLLVLGIAAFYFIQSPGKNKDGFMGRKTDSLQQSTAAPIKVKPEVPKLALPVSIDLGTEKGVFDIQVLNAKIDNYGTSYAFKAYGYLEAKEEIEELKVVATLLDKNGQPILPGKSFTLLMGHEANARPGDKVPWDMLIFEESKLSTPIKSVRIEPSQINKVEGSGAYPEPKELGPVVWLQGKPQGHELVFRERRMNITQSGFIKKAYARCEWELENKGLEKYSTVKVRMVWKGKAGQTETETYALSSDFPFLLPGRKVPFGGTFEIGEHIARDFYGYEIHIIEWN